MTRSHRVAKLTLLYLGAAIAVRGDVVATYAENPGIQLTTVPGAFVTNFDNLSTGINLNVPFMEGATQVGTYDTLNVSDANQFGGAGGSRFVTDSGNAQSILTLTTPVAYFGLWWSAGDPNNLLQFMSGSTLVAQFTTTKLLAALPSAYFGNPTTQFLGQDSSEAFAYVNFYGQGGVTWDHIVFTNSGGTGFESDNHALRQTPWNTSTDGPYPGVVFEEIDGTTEVEETTPEPASFTLMAGAFLLFASGLRKRVLNTRTGY